ncbi:membrane-associated guanylate kinase, WW and PDZ domain-containing protein 2-like isoform X2 [Tigriopus californicus]|uniref:membrane-associated guanylate kinase, WW and PDZ domain-containing protein 2-like isoform X2 n=1 Tax=Tigriopus californicus TaxID=6832 RepID=UPI0027DA8E64|nr:membrane-associated guanylate kinase, WW and PDZ domain-containing protein 2-like isoform X2 [Tigriopus californicus]
MCSVIEIKNNNEYYIHYHSPDSLEPCSMDPDDNHQPEEDHHHSDNEDKPEEDKDCSVGEITHSPPTKDPGKADDKTSDKGSSLDGDESETPSSHKSTNDSPHSSPSKHCSDVPITVNSHIPAHPARSSSIPVLSRNRTVEIGTQMERDQTKNQRNDDHDIKAELKRRSSSVPSPVLKSDIKSWDERQLERAQSKSRERDTTSPSKIPIKVDHKAKKGSLSVSSLFERSDKSKPITPQDKQASKQKSNSISNLKIEKGNKPQISTKAATQETKKRAEEARKLEKSKANEKKKQKKALKATTAEEEKKSPKAKKVAENTKEKAKRVLSFRRSKKDDAKDKTKLSPEHNGQENKTAPPGDSTDGLKILETSDGYFVLPSPRSEPTSATSKEYNNQGAITTDLRQYLNARFPKGGVDHELQNTIRDNLYLRTVPVTTRTPRPEERHGTDYTFLSKDEFMALEKSGELLESGVYDGNHYGTPKPPSESTSSLIHQLSGGGSQSTAEHTHQHQSGGAHQTHATPPAGSQAAVNFPGAHPSSEGKRRRNRSNVEAMTAKHFEAEDDQDEDPSSMMTSGSEHQNRLGIGKDDNDRQVNGPDTPSGSSGGSSSKSGSGPHGADSGHPDSPEVLPPDDPPPTEESLGPLPPNWEKAYTDKGEAYFIDHNTGTSHWLDPRLSRVQKKRPEECDENELPFGWERIDDPHYGTYFIDHVNRRTQYENPVLVAKSMNQSGDGLVAPSYGSGTIRQGPAPPPAPPLAPPNGPAGTFPRVKKSHSPFFTRDPNQLRGERIRCQLVKSARGLGFTIVGGDDNVDEFLQIKSVVPNGPAWADGGLKTGDVLVFVNDTCVLGFTHHDMVTMFQSIATGDIVNLEVCRGYPLPFDPDDPNTEIVTTVAVTSPEQNEWASELERQRQHYQGQQPAPDAQSMPDLSHHNQYPSGTNHHLRPGSADLLGQNDYGENSSDFSSEVKNTLSAPQADGMTIPITKGGMGFGFTIADSAYGQKVKKILDWPRCKNLQEGDVLVEINLVNVRNKSHSEVVQVLKDCPRGQEANISIQRGLLSPNTNGAPGGLGTSSSNQSSPVKNKYKRDKFTADFSGLKPKSGMLFRSKTPTAEIYATQEKEKVPLRPKTPIVDTRNFNRSKTPTSMFSIPFQRNDVTRASLGVAGSTSQYDPYGGITNQMGGLNLHDYNRSQSPGRELDGNYYNQGGNYPQPGLDYPGGYQPDPLYNTTAAMYPEYNNINYSQQQMPSPGKMYGDTYQNYNGNSANPHYDPTYGYTRGAPQGDIQAYRAGSLPRNGGGSGSVTGRKESTSFEHSEPLPGGLTRWPRPERRPVPSECIELTVTLHRQDSGFGFRIVGGTEEGSQVSIGHIVPGGAADVDGRLYSGDEIIAVDGSAVLNTSHHQVVELMGEAAHQGRVTLTVRRRLFQHDSYGRIPENYPYDVTVTRRENEGFGFVIISSVSRAGSTIGRIIPGSPAERCGRLHVGDRILAVNHVDINCLHHGEIVNLIKDSGYSVVMTVGPPIDDTSSNASTSHREDQELNMLELDDQYYAVELQRGARGFGFSIRGGREFHSMPLFVLRIAVDGPAAADGRLRVGDQIIEINGINTKNMTHGEAIELIKSGGAMVRLLVRRGKMPPSALMEQVGLSPLSPTPTVSMSAMGRPMSAMSQPSHTMMANPNAYHANLISSHSNYSNNNNFGNGYLPQHPTPPTGNGMVPTPFTAATAMIPNGHLNGPMGHSSPRMAFPPPGTAGVVPTSSASSNDQYNWYNQQNNLYHNHH